MDTRGELLDKHFFLLWHAQTHSLTHTPVDNVLWLDGCRPASVFSRADIIGKLEIRDGITWIHFMISIYICSWFSIGRLQPIRDSYLNIYIYFLQLLSTCPSIHLLFSFYRLAEKKNSNNLKKREKKTTASSEAFTSKRILFLKWTHVHRTNFFFSGYPHFDPFLFPFFLSLSQSSCNDQPKSFDCPSVRRCSTEWKERTNWRNFFLGCPRMKYKHQCNG